MNLIKYGNKLVGKNGILAGYLPAFTIRLKFTLNVTPSFSKGTAVQVPGWPGYWDLTYNNPDWTELLEGQDELKAVISSNTSGVTSMAGMFGGCTALERVFQLDTSSVTDMEEMFGGCLVLTGFDDPLDTSNVTSMQGMFYYCQRLQANQFRLSNTSNVTNMSAMFYGANFNNGTAPSMDTSSLTNAYTMFALSNVSTVPLYDTSSVTNAEAMFYGCESLTTIPLFDTTSMTNVDAMFSDCYNVQSGALAIYNQMASQANPPSSHLETFYGCGSSTTTGAAELAQIPSDWK